VPGLQASPPSLAAAAALLRYIADVEADRDA